jgi:short-subunit dehydrogenase
MSDPATPIPAPEATPSGRRRALVTGASSGIGAAYARRLAADDWDLVLVARRVPELEALAGELKERRGVGAEVLAADLTDPGDLGRVEQRVRDDAALELLVNNAGFGTTGPFHESDLARQTQMLRLNVEALVRLTHAAVGRMVEHARGEIVNVSSGVGLMPAPFFATYGASKAFVVSFSEAVAEELAGKGVSVQVLCPGFTRTEFQQVSDTDVSNLPDMLWQDAEEVVEASLEGLRKGTLVVVPGLKNRVPLAFRGVVGRTLVRKAFGAAGRRGWLRSL